MIRETIITTRSEGGEAHIAPMGLHNDGDELILMPFRPSTTLENILTTRSAVINYTDDVRIFAGCVTGRKHWPLEKAGTIIGYYLADALSHAELQLVTIKDDPVRPKLYCKVLREVTHAPFRGFNRAQFAVVEAAILVTRLHLLPWPKIESEIEYLKIGLEKTAGNRERVAWDWLVQVIAEFKAKNPQKVKCA